VMKKRRGEERDQLILLIKLLCYKRHALAGGVPACTL
jgi:hypothetical protein